VLVDARCDKSHHSLSTFLRSVPPVYGRFRLICGDLNAYGAAGYQYREIRGFAGFRLLIPAQVEGGENRIKRLALG
jgi:hypothetical protein